MKDNYFEKNFWKKSHSNRYAIVCYATTYVGLESYN